MKKAIILLKRTFKPQYLLCLITFTLGKWEWKVTWPAWESSCLGRLDDTFSSPAQSTIIMHWTLFIFWKAHNIFWLALSDTDSWCASSRQTLVFCVLSCNWFIFILPSFTMFCLFSWVLWSPFFFECSKTL